MVRRHRCCRLVALASIAAIASAATAGVVQNDYLAEDAESPGETWILNGDSPEWLTREHLWLTRDHPAWRTSSNKQDLGPDKLRPRTTPVRGLARLGRREAIIDTRFDGWLDPREAGTIDRSLAALLTSDAYDLALFDALLRFAESLAPATVTLPRNLAAIKTVEAATVPGPGALAALLVLSTLPRRRRLGAQR